MIKHKRGDIIEQPENIQIEHTVMGTTISPAKFLNGDKVKTSQTVDMDNIIIPQDVILCISGVMDNDMYNCIGPEGLTVRLHGAYLEKVKED